MTHLDECQSRSNCQISNSRLVRIAELGILQVHISKDLEVLVNELGKPLLSTLVAAGHAKDDICNVRKTGVYGGLTPIHHHVNLGTKDGIRGVEFFSSLVVQAQVSHDGTALWDETIRTMLI
jgi:hypothetical protein